MNTNTTSVKSYAEERGIVLSILVECELHKGYSSTLIRRAQDRHTDLTPEQRAFIKRLAEGTIEREIELDGIIRRHLKNPSIQLKSVIRCLLRMSIYQIYYMDSVPDFAACNEAVHLCRKHHLDAQAGFVNGLLRAVCREKAEHGSGRTISEQWSMPQVIVDLWNDQLGSEHTESLCRAMMEIRPVCIRLSPALSSEEKDQALEAFREAGVETIPGKWARDCFYLKHASASSGSGRLSGGVSGLPGFHEGRWTVQDESSQLIAAACGLYGNSSAVDHSSGGDGSSGGAGSSGVAGSSGSAVPSDNAGSSDIAGSDRSVVVADVCAAPGGKTMLLAQLLPDARVYSFDLTRAKTSIIRANLERMKIHNVSISENDAANPGPSMTALAGKADIVLCDVPCSGLGVMTKKRDIKYNFSLQKVYSLVSLQKKIVLHAASLVKPGGILVYSTCTINRVENEKMAAFIEKNTDLTADALAPYFPNNFPGIEGNHVQLFPDIHGTDGFFIARFRAPLTDAHADGE